MRRPDIRQASDSRVSSPKKPPSALGLGPFLPGKQVANGSHASTDASRLGSPLPAGRGAKPRDTAACAESPTNGGGSSHQLFPRALSLNSDLDGSDESGSLHSDPAGDDRSATFPPNASRSGSSSMGGGQKPRDKAAVQVRLHAPTRCPPRFPGGAAPPAGTPPPAPQGRPAFP